VGAQFAKALIDLQERIHILRPEDADNHKDFMAYLEEIGYLEFGHCPDYALGLLAFAEHYQLQPLWVDAFAHCVGMNDQLSLSAEFEVKRVQPRCPTR
jgi:hypothetical protein